MSRTRWAEWDGDTVPGTAEVLDLVVLTAVGHPDSVDAMRAALVVELAQTGIADSYGVAYAQAERTALTYGWFGYIDGAIEPSWCDGSGMTAGEDQVDRPIPCVYALVRR